MLNNIQILLVAINNLKKRDIVREWMNRKKTREEFKRNWLYGERILDD